MPRNTGVPKRRLSFADYADMLAEVEALLRGGYTSRGNWNLAQTCAHLADWIRFPMDGYPRPPLPIRAMFWIMRITVANSMKRKIVAEGFKGGSPTAPETVHPPGEKTDEAAAAELRATIERARAFDGELRPSPLFGPMDPALWTRVNLLHAEHHLGYLDRAPAAADDRV